MVVSRRKEGEELLELEIFLWVGRAADRLAEILDCFAPLA